MEEDVFPWNQRLPLLPACDFTFLPSPHQWSLGAHPVLALWLRSREPGGPGLPRMGSTGVLWDSTGVCLGIPRAQ